MSFALIPGHKNITGRDWQTVKLSEDLLDSIKNIGNFQLGNYGNTLNTKYDSFAAHYSIPTPWASAYLFNSVLCISNHPLKESILELLLNLLYDIYITGSLEVLAIEKPEKDTPFRNFWDLVPFWLKNVVDGIESIAILKEQNNEVVGGLSKYTLCWASQNYVPKLKIDEIKKNNDFIEFLCKVKENGYPEELSKDDFNTFWSHDVFDLAQCPQVNRNNAINFPFQWVDKKQYKPPIDSVYYYNKYFIFDYTVLRRGNLFDNAPPDFTKLLKEKKRGEQLPLNLGKEKWLLFQELFEDKIIRLNRYTNSGNVSEEVNIYADNYAFPLKNEYINIFTEQLFNSITSENIVKRENYLLHHFTQKIVESNNSFKEILTQEIIEDNRSIAIWPPFGSQHLPIYVAEYDLNGISDRPESKFYNHSGEILKSNRIRKENKLRIYKINGYNEENRTYEFPYFIQIFTNNGASGLIHISPREIVPTIKEIKVGLDFGSSNTTVAYIDKQLLESYLKQNDYTNLPIELMNFRKSSPIILADDDSKGGLLHDFIPMEIKDFPPETKKDYSIVNSWLPFRTLWRFITDVDELEDYYLNGGVIPLSDHPENLYSQSKLKRNLKWDTESKYRNGFLSHILNMIIVESEALGAQKIEIRWSRPKAFSDTENHTMESFYQLEYKTKRKDIIDIKECGYSEALCSKEYFTKKEKFLPTKVASTVDIGGGTTDITFFRKDAVIGEDSVKFGGDDIGDIILPFVLPFLRTDISSSNKQYPFDAHMRLWPAVHKTWNGEIANFRNLNPLKFYETIGLFYSGISFYIGLKMRDLDIHDPLKYIAFAGNGIQFLNICTNGMVLDETNLKPWIQLFKTMVAEGQGINEKEYSALKFIFSKDPKKEVAFGLTLVDEENLDSDTIRPMLGLNIIGKNSNNTIEWNYKDKIKCNDIAINYSIDYNHFLNFIDKFYSTISQIQSDYFNDIRRTNISIQVIKDDVERLLLHRKDDLVTPLFFLALKSWIDHIKGK